MSIETIENDLNDKKMQGQISLANAFHKDQIIEIPPFQRPYVWDTTNLEQFFNSFMEIDDDEKVFMGMMLLEKDDLNIKILDGQQRILTSLCAISAAYYSISNKNDISLVYNDLERVVSIATSTNLLDRCNSSKGFTLKINLNNVSTESEKIYKDTIEGNNEKIKPEGYKVPNNSPVESKYIQRAFVFFKNKFSDPIMDSDKIIDFIFKVVNKSNYIGIRTTTPEESFTLFETLNARGMSLRSNELIKNHYYCINKKDDRPTFETNWKKIMANLAECGVTDPEPFFINTWYSISYTIDGKKKDPASSSKKISNKTCYEAYTEAVKYTSGGVKYLTEHILLASKIYKSFNNKNTFEILPDSLDIGIDKQIKDVYNEHGYILKRLQYPSIIFTAILPAILHHKQEKPAEHDKFLNCLESFIIRCLWIDKARKSTDFVSTVAQNLSNGKTLSKEREEIYEEIKKTGKKRRFEESFKMYQTDTWRSSSADTFRIKMIFDVLFNSDKKFSMDNTQTYTIEHIAAKSGKNVNDEFVLSHLLYFGNITVITHWRNSRSNTMVYGKKYKEYTQEKMNYLRYIEIICQEFLDNPQDEKILDICNPKYEDYFNKKMEDHPVEEDALWTKERYEVWEKYLYTIIDRKWPERSKLVQQYIIEK